MNLDGKSPVLIDSQNRFGTILEMVMSDTVELWAVDALAAALCISTNMWLPTYQKLFCWMVRPDDAARYIRFCGAVLIIMTSIHLVPF